MKWPEGAPKQRLRPNEALQDAYKAQTAERPRITPRPALRLNDHFSQGLGAPWQPGPELRFRHWHIDGLDVAIPRDTWPLCRAS